MEVDPPSDRIELDFRVDGHPMGSRVVTGAVPLFTADAHGANGVSLFNRVELIRDGVVLDSQVRIGNTIHWEFRDLLAEGESHWYYVRVRQVDGDLAWSAPVWVTAEIDPSSVEIAGAPGVLRLLPSVPNPTSGATAVRFILPGEGGIRPVRLVVQDAAGRRVTDTGQRRTPLVRKAGSGCARRGGPARRGRGLPGPRAARWPPAALRPRGAVK